MDKVNDHILYELLYNGTNAVPLFDVSHGAGILPDAWPNPISGVECGYAGGLGPDNIADQLQKISEAAGEYPIWIDMETKVRSKGDKQFDLEKVGVCLEIAKAYVR